MTDDNRRNPLRLDETPLPQKKSLALVTRGSWTRPGEQTVKNLQDILDSGAEDYENVTLSASEEEKLTKVLKKMTVGSAIFAPMKCGGHECQPAGTLIDVVGRGQVPIEDLDETKDRLICYDFNSHLIKGGKTPGYGFKIYSRRYDGYLLTLQTDTEAHAVTPEHICITRWNDRASSAFVVYLMEKDGLFRIGMTKLLKGYENNQVFGPSQRANAEKADKLWVLRVCGTKSEALLAKEAFSVKWGVPKALFVATDEKERVCNGLVDQDRLDLHHRSLQGSQEHYARCLASAGLNICYPFWSRDKSDSLQMTVSVRAKTFDKFGGNNVLIVRACNLLSGYMEVPTVPGEPVWRKYKKADGSISEKKSGVRPKWKTISVDQVPYSGLVYSLDVKKYKTYIANSIVTHNCPFAADCPLVQMGSGPHGKAPVGLPCLLEETTFRESLGNYVREYEVDPNSMTELTMCSELAEIEVLLWRLNMTLRQPEHASLVTEQTVGVTPQGNEITQLQVSPIFEQKRKLSERKSKLHKLMVGDRQEKYKKEAALKQSNEKDASSQMSDVKKQLQTLQQNMRRVSSSNSEVIEAQIVSADDIIAKTIARNKEKAAKPPETKDKDKDW